MTEAPLSALAVPGSAAATRHAAHQILSERRFHAPAVPRPLHGLLHAIGDGLAPVGRAIGSGVTSAAGLLGGGTGWVVLAGLILLCSGLLAARRSRRALSGVRTGELGSSRSAPLPAAALARAAAAAERDGRLEEAVRLHFQAGLAGLAERELLAFVPSMSNADVGRTLRSARFDLLARRFDEIVYGERPAGRDDVELARREWPLVLGRGAER